MAEQFAHVIRTTGAAPTGDAHVDAVANAIMGIGLHWLWQSSEPGKALLQCIATGAQLVLHGSSNQIQIGYAPDGGIIDWNGVPSAPVFTGMRNITGAAGAMSSITTQLSLAEYEDAILIAIGSTVAGWRYASLCGRAMEPMDASDITRAIGLDVMYIGIPSRTVASPNWLVGSSTANTGSCVRVGNSFAPIIALSAMVVNPGANATGDRYIARIDNVERFLPYYMHILTGAGISQVVGQTKYIRQWRANVDHGTRLFSQTAGSEQAWHGHQFDATKINQFLLWAKTESTV